MWMPICPKPSQKRLEISREFWFSRRVFRRCSTLLRVLSIAAFFSTTLLPAQTIHADEHASVTNAIASAESNAGTNITAAVTAPATNAVSAAATGPAPTFKVGEKTFENVTLVAFDGVNVTISHAYGTKTLPILVFTSEEVETLNKTTDKVFIDASRLDLTPPTPEAIKEAEALIQTAGDVNGLLPNGNTPLIEAIANGRGDIIKVLIAHNANVNQLDGSGTSPLKEAENRGNPKIIDLLKSSGAKHVRKALPKTPYMLECEKGIQEARAKVKLLNDQVKALRSSAASYRAKAAQASRALASPAEKAHAGEYLQKATEEESKAKYAAYDIPGWETQAKNWENNLAQAIRQQTAEADEAEKREAEATARLSRPQTQPSAIASGESASAGNVVPPETYRDPGMDQMKQQAQQAQALATTAQSMMDIMNSKTAAEKEVERQVAETKAKLAKVPPYVKYIVWCGILFFVAGALLFISLAFYDSMGWGFIVFFFGPPAVLIYFILHPKEMWFSFALYIFGLLMWAIPVVVYQVGLFDFLF